MTKRLHWCAAVSIIAIGPARSQTPAQTAAFDPKAASLLRDVERATLATMSLTARVTLIRSASGKASKADGSVRLLRPNFARVAIRGKQGQTVAANGKQLWVYNAATNQFVTRKTVSDGRGLSPAFGPRIPVAMFFNPTALTSTLPPGTRVRLEKPVVRRGVQMQVVAFFSPQMDIRLFVGPDLLVRRSTAVAARGGNTIDVELTGVKLNTPLPASSFAYKPPKGASEMPGSIDVKLSPPSGKQNTP